jgi:dihydrofolate reductase
MGKIVVTEFVSVDGVVEDPGGVEGFQHGGWAFEISRGEEGEQFKFDEALASDALLLGRRTYDTFAASWPKRSGEWADKLNSMPKYVVSSTLVDPAWSNTTVISGELDEHVAKMKQAHDGDITVHGSTQLVHALVEQDLVDELRLMVFPVILGAGQRLFGQTSDKMALRLVESRTVGDGVTIVTYATVRRATTAVDGAGVETERAAAFGRAGTREGA